jgi:hypothetical protein
VPPPKTRTVRDAFFMRTETSRTIVPRSPNWQEKPASRWLNKVSFCRRNGVTYHTSEYTVRHEKIVNLILAISRDGDGS